MSPEPGTSQTYIACSAGYIPVDNSHLRLTPEAVFAFVTFVLSEVNIDQGVAQLQQEGLEATI